MRIQDTGFVLKDGRQATLGFATKEDASQILALLWKTADETPFLGRCGDDVSSLTIADQIAYLDLVEKDPYRVCIFCWVEGLLVGSCEMEIMTRKRMSHRATVSLCVVQEYWGLGIGSKMMETLIGIARMQPTLKQLELEYYECNVRARALYEKYGFRTVSVCPDALLLDDGSMLNEYWMVLKL